MVKVMDEGNNINTNPNPNPNYWFHTIHPPQPPPNAGFILHMSPDLL